MLNHLLAGFVALGSLVLFLSGFLFPEVQRKPDLAWSGVALLYALLLLGEGDRASGGALLGHIASVALILWFGWQTLQQRRQFATPETQTAIPGSLEALTPFLKEGWGRIMTTYNETAAWVQDQLGKEETILADEVRAQAPQAKDEAEDEDQWDTGTVSTSALANETATESATESVTLLAVTYETTPSGDEDNEAVSSEDSVATAAVENLDDLTEMNILTQNSDGAESSEESADKSEVSLAEERPIANETAVNDDSQTPPSESTADLSEPVAENNNLTNSPEASANIEDDKSWPPPTPED